MARPLTRLPLIAGIAAGLVAGGLTTAIAVGGETVDPPPRIAFVARSDNPADALAAGPVAGQLGAPLFVTPTGTLVDAAKAGLIAYAPELIVITGGFAAISAETEAAIEAAVGLPDDKVVRARGDDRHETAVAIVDLLAAYNPAYLPVDAKALAAVVADEAGDADTLDGIDSTGFVGTDDPRLTWSESLPVEAATIFGSDAVYSLGGGGNHSGMLLPDTGFPRFLVGMTLPPAYESGTDIEVFITWGNDNFNATDCDFRFESNGVRAFRDGLRVLPPATFPDDGVFRGFDDSYTLLHAPSTPQQVRSTTMVIAGGDPTPLEPGDHVVMSFNRDPDEANDTCTGGLYVFGLTARTR